MTTEVPDNIKFEDYFSSRKLGYLLVPIVEDASGLDVCFAELPYEMQKDILSGCKSGGGYLRANTIDFTVSDYRLNVDTIKSINSGDIGKLNIEDSTQDAAKQSIFEGITNIINNGAVSFIVGGDSQTALPQIEACANKLGEIAIINFSGSLNKTLIDSVRLNTVKADNCIQIGAREGYEKYGEAYKEAGIKIISTGDMCYSGFAKSGKTANNTQLPTFVMFDVNLYDPSSISAAADPCVCGLESHEVIELLESALLETSICGVSFYGLLSYNDPYEISITKATEAMAKIHAILAKNLS